MANPSSVLRAFAADRRAVAAVELAVIMPFLLMLYLGQTELTRTLNAKRKLQLAARTVADLVSREPTSVTDGRLDIVVAAAKAALAPIPVDSLAIRIKSFGTFRKNIIAQYADEPNSAHIGQLCWTDSFGTETAKANLLPANPSKSQQGFFIDDAEDEKYYGSKTQFDSFPLRSAYIWAEVSISVPSLLITNKIYTLNARHGMIARNGMVPRITSNPNPPFNQGMPVWATWFDRNYSGPDAKGCFSSGYPS